MVAEDPLQPPGDEGTCPPDRCGSGRKWYFEEPVRAVTPGQAVVFYDGEYVAGGGTIIQ